MNKPSHKYCKECNDWNGNISNCMEICYIPIEMIKEWEQYRAIGTVEECRAAVEKQKVKPLEEKINPDFPHIGKMYYCTCGVAYLERGARCCGNCG